MTPDVVVVGAGPAGLAAAAMVARLGASVSILDEQMEAGGQLRYRVQPVVAGVGLGEEPPAVIAERLIHEARAAGVRFDAGTVAAGLFPNRELLAVHNGDGRRLSPDAVILATGSTDLPFPFPGATLPGVFSARGLQTMMHVHRVCPGRRFAVIGGDAYAEEVAGDVLLAGGAVTWSGIAPPPFLRAEGGRGVSGLIVGQERHSVDVIVVAVGRQADYALAAMASMPSGFAAELGGFVPVVDERMASIAAGVFVAGDAAGVGSVAAAIAEGRLAGAGAAEYLGLSGSVSVDEARAAGGGEMAWRHAIRASLPFVAVQPYV